MFILGSSILLNILLMYMLPDHFFGHEINFLLWGMWSIVTLCFVMAAIQIYRHNRYQIFKTLLYLSIPFIYFKGIISYQFTFFSHLIVTMGSSDALSFNFEFFAHIFSINYNILISTTPEDEIVQFGINLVPILILVVLKRLNRTKVQ